MIKVDRRKVVIGYNEDDDIKKIYGLLMAELFTGIKVVAEHVAMTPKEIIEALGDFDKFRKQNNHDKTEG